MKLGDAAPGPAYSQSHFTPLGQIGSTQSKLSHVLSTTPGAFFGKEAFSVDHPNLSRDPGC